MIWLLIAAWWLFGWVINILVVAAMYKKITVGDVVGTFVIAVLWPAMVGALITSKVNTDKIIWRKK